MLQAKGAGYIHSLKKCSEFIPIYDLKRNVVYEININLTQNAFSKTHVKNTLYANYMRG